MILCVLRYCTDLHLPETPKPSNSPGHASAPSTSQADRLPSGSPPLGDTSVTPDPGANSRQSQLSMIAASASEMVPQGMSMDQDSAIDGLPRLSGSWGSSHEQLLFESLQEHDPSLTAATQRATSYPRPIAMNPNSQAKGFVNDFGNSTKPSKPKVRGRFSAARRREVQEVRKRGACIRCRMLKKPVRFTLLSNHTPSDCYFSVLVIARVPPALVLKARVCGNIRASARALLKNLSFMAQVRFPDLFFFFENQADSP